MWAPGKTDLARLREIKGLEDLHNRICTDVSPLVHPNGSLAAVILGLAASRA